ncbi:MAG: LamG domain-containing protein, partial [Flavobacteriaceae bacterium]|nr:LamG domain-containing protein [Flavobacteriaceae bacterium]
MKCFYSLSEKIFGAIFLIATNLAIGQEFNVQSLQKGTATVETNFQAKNPADPNLGPAGITNNIQLWLKANHGVEEAAGDLAEDTDAVLNWLDRSGGNNDATQAIATKQPIYSEATINFNPTLNFDGINHEMIANSNANGAITVFAVANGTFSGTKNLLNLYNGGSGSVVIEQTAATTLRGCYYDDTTVSGIVSTTIANGTSFLMNYDHLAGGTSELFEDGISQGTASANADNLTGSLTVGVGTHPTNAAERWDGGIAELIVYNQILTTTERVQIESYLALKYGFTLGTNGTSQDYLDSDGSVIWDQSENLGFNYNVTGLGRDDNSELDQKQSKTINATDDITIGIKTLATTNDGNTAEFFADKTFLIWGNDNGAITATTDITKDFGSGTGTATNVSATPIVRKWKMVVKDSVPTVKISIPETMVSATNPGGEKYVMIVADDAAFTINVTSATMKDVGSNLEVEFYFEGTKYVTFGSAAETTELARAVSFDRSDMYLSAGDVNDLANTDFTISAWIKRDPGTGNFDIISKRNFFNENTDLDPGPDNDGNYSHGYALRIDQDNKFRMVWRDPEDTSNNILQTSASIPENEWHHMCAVYDSSEGALGTTRLYIDGILEDTDDTLDPMNVASDAHFMIGAAHHIKRQQRHGGSVDEVRVWNVALSADQIRYIMNQEIEQNASLADGKVLPTTTTKNEINAMPWNNLIAYYPMNKMVFGSMMDYSNSGNDASMINYDHVDEQTAPLPYLVAQSGDWDTSTTWVNGDVQYLPGVSSYLDAVETIDYNIVQMDDNYNVTMDNTNLALIPATNNNNRTLLGLIINDGDLEIEGDNDSGTGNALTVSHYLKLNGNIDLEGESQLIQTTDSDLDVTSSGTVERDQQGTADTYTYNYWASPVGVSNTTSNNNSYTLPDVVRDGTQNINFLTGGYDGTDTNPIGIADYWIWKFANQLDDDFASWQHIRSTGSISAGEGYTMKGPGTGPISSEQNYVYIGKPNNGDINLTLSANNDYLLGNPYASAIDAEQFILDNGAISGTLYFWKHWGGGSHNLADYLGGYAIYNLSGGTPSASMGSNDPDVGTGGIPTKTPGRYIPVGQGFFVLAENNGTINFNNGQRVFQKESENSVFTEANNPDNNTILGRNVTDPADLVGDPRLKIRLGFYSVNTIRRQLILTIDENATDAIDGGYDGALYEDQMGDMYWMIENQRFVIQATNYLDDYSVFPIGVKSDDEGINIISLDDMINTPDTMEIYVYDKELDLYHDLLAGDYEFFKIAGETLDRFEITFSPGALGIDDNELNALDLHYSNDLESIILINPTLKNINSIEVINVLGQTIYTVDNNLNSDYAEYKVN